MTSADEIAWAFRKTLEQAAAERPLVVVFDDIQWGEQTFLDLIEHVALLSSGAPILLLCVARRELADHRAGWPVTLRLEPLPDEDVEQLIGEGTSVELRQKIARAAGGNPLFVHEMLAMAGEADGQVSVPPTLQALLAARLDQLETAERSVLERGAIEGEIFHRGAVQALGAEAQVSPRLAALVRKELIRPDKPQLPGEDAFRFRHLLIRDAAYDALPKAARAELHERFAVWLEQHGADLVELDEILGYHLERAGRYRSELGMPVDAKQAANARRRLSDAGRRAYLRQDYGAAMGLLERAAALVPAGELDLGLETGLVDALFYAGRGGDALSRAASLSERAAAAGDPVGELCGRIKEGMFRTFLDPEGATEQLDATIEQALPVFEAANDHLALFVAYHASAQVANMRARHDARLEAAERAAVHAGQAGLPYQLLGWRAGGRVLGMAPLPEVLAWFEEEQPKEIRDHHYRGYRASALAMAGRFDEARAIIAELRAELADRGGGRSLAGVMGLNAVEIELLAGDSAAAVELGEEGCRILDELGEQSMLSTAAGRLAQSLYALDRLDDADGWAGRAAELGASDDAMTQMLWRQARAKVLARKGQYAEGERLAREAVAIADDTDGLTDQADTRVDLAEVLELAGRPEEATEVLEGALDRYRRKGNLVMVARVRERLGTLQETPH